MTLAGRLDGRALVDWVRLALADQVGPLTFHRLLQRHGGAAQALAALPELRARGAAPGNAPLPGRSAAEDYIAQAQRQGIRLLPSCDPDYPELLRQIADPPPLLHLAGSAERLAQPGVALVGARNASALGRRLAADLARGLGSAGWTVVSGLARGIDAAAHEAALETGTIAVLAGGLDRPYPRENEPLLQRILGEGGLAASEVALGVHPQARHFPRRNRLVSGLSHGVVVIEAALRSGSLITARRAAEQGRDVFAVPGSPADPRARGCNAMIKDGAALVESAEDVLAGLRRMPCYLPRLAVERPEGHRPAPERPEADQPAPATAAPPPLMPMEGLETRLLGLLGVEPVSVDLLVRELAAPSAELATAMLELEMAGRLRRHPGNMVSLP